MNDDSAIILAAGLKEGMSNIHLVGVGGNPGIGTNGYDALVKDPYLPKTMKVLWFSRDWHEAVKHAFPAFPFSYILSKFL